MDPKYPSSSIQTWDLLKWRSRWWDQNLCPQSQWDNSRNWAPSGGHKVPYGLRSPSLSSICGITCISVWKNVLLFPDLTAIGWATVEPEVHWEDNGTGICAGVDWRTGSSGASLLFLEPSKERFWGAHFKVLYNFWINLQFYMDPLPYIYYCQLHKYIDTDVKSWYR